MANAVTKVPMGLNVRSDSCIKRVPAAVAQTWYPGAMVALNAAGNAVKGDDTAGNRFDGINVLTSRLQINSDDTLLTMAADQSKQVVVTRPFRFGMAIAAAAAGDEGKVVYAVDDQTVGYTSTNLIPVGWVDQVLTATSVLVNPISRLDEMPLGGASTLALTPLTVNGAIPPNTPATYIITKAGVLADTLAAPTAGGPGVGSDGTQIVITSGTAFAHTITTVGLLNTGSASVNVATFAAFAGAGITLVAYNGKFNVLNSVGVTFS